MNALPSIKLSVLTGKIQQALSDVFAEQTWWVVADVTNYSFYAQKGYHYFDLVEKDPNAGGIVAKVSAVAWGNGAIRIKEFEIVTGQQFKNDIHVLIKVSVAYHQVHGLQITLLDIDTNFTVGQLEQQKQQTLIRLTTECADFIRKVGDRYITRNNQLPLRSVIQKIAVVTSGNSAGYQDFRHTLDHNHFGYTFFIDNYFTVVQGETKAELVQQRLIDIYNSGIPYDAVVIIRGGGAQTDFLIFDTFILGRAVAKFPIPVITGIGHQKNETITDLMAHSATKTPTKAAELIIAHNRTFEESVISMQQTILIRSQQLFSAHFQALSSLNAGIINQTRTILATHKEELHTYNSIVLHTSKSILLHHHRELITISNAVLARPRIMVANKLNDLDNIVANFRSFSRMYIQSKRAQVAHYDSLFKLMSPANILKRGFAIIYQDGHIISNAQSLQPGSHIKVVLQDAELEATITTKNNTHEPGTNI
ncbi:exodeoxyribonuclease VII large subunit [Chitinophaga niastensis]|uniref:Exodeoxyribonuclease 7 large subunit n=1 Tax=Chitinophaga niastensis TaxID=536980 RepID=A0A2P8HF39_CHINA|nr:exodeoxyribonuclease VII large subunit [Chitinophaga niastensis]PSL44821.1 exodeoxyribonuclease VII large subunit [Chitinophaga niastensis]